MHAMTHSYLETIQNLLTRSPFEPCHIYINPNKNRADSYAVLNVTYCVVFPEATTTGEPGEISKKDLEDLRLSRAHVDEADPSSMTCDRDGIGRFGDEEFGMPLGY